MEPRIALEPAAAHEPRQPSDTGPASDGASTAPDPPPPSPAATTPPAPTGPHPPPASAAADPISPLFPPSLPSPAAAAAAPPDPGPGAASPGLRHRPAAGPAHHQSPQRPPADRRAQDGFAGHPSPAASRLPALGSGRGIDYVEPDLLYGRDGGLGLDLDLDFGGLNFIDAMESFAAARDAGEDGGGGGGEGVGAAAGGEGMSAEEAEEAEARSAAAVMGCIGVPEGGPDAVMAEAFVDMHELFHELPQQLHELQEERRESQGTPQQRRKFVARLLGLRLVRRVLGPRGVLLRDKLSFLLGTTMMWTCAFWLGRSPSTFPALYGGLGAVLMLARWASYMNKRWHYYLYDFCYYANLLLVLHLTLLPKWAPLAKVTFAYNTGPLAWSILTFRNSLVFHDLDKVTSLFLHLVPALVSWSLRWQQPEGGRFRPAAEAGEQERSRWQAAGVVSNVVVPMVAYVAWAVAYYLKIFVFSRAKIQQRGYRTLFQYVTSQKKGTFHSIARRIPQSLQPPAYLGLHLCFCATTFLVALLCWYNFWVHTALLAAVASASIWHGGSYYFEVFARRYHEQLRSSELLPPTGSRKDA